MRKSLGGYRGACSLRLSALKASQSSTPKSG